MEQAEQAVDTSQLASIPNVAPQFGRMKGAIWFQDAMKKDLLVIGQGGIGSWLTLLLTRLGTIVHTFDMDRYEAHNMTGQLVRNNDIGKLKTTAVFEICRLFNENARVYTNGEYRSDSYDNSIVMCALDNMQTRKLAFSKWRTYVESALAMTNKYQTGEDFVKTYFFQDGRLKADQLQIFNIPGDRPDLMDEYERELFDDAEVGEGDCTFKQTSHCAAMIASHMVAFYTNWLTNVATNDPEYTKLPFFYEYVIPFNMTLLK